MSRGIRSVTLEWDDDKGGRVSKQMSDGAARREYQRLMTAGKNPKVIRAER